MKGVTSTYSERRTPKDHKLYRITLVLTFGGASDHIKIQERLAKAFEADRKEAVSASKNHTGYTYKFSDDKGSSSYTLTGYQIVKKWQSVDADIREQSDATTVIINGTSIDVISKADLKKKKKLQREKARLQRQLAKKEREKKKLERQLKKNEYSVQHDLAQRKD